MDFAIRLLELGVVGGVVGVVAYLLLIRNGQIGSRRFDSFGPLLGVVAVVGLLLGLLTGHGITALLGAVGLAIGVAVGGGATSLLLGRVLPPEQ